MTVRRQPLYLAPAVQTPDSHRFVPRSRYGYRLIGDDGYQTDRRCMSHQGTVIPVNIVSNTAADSYETNIIMPFRVQLKHKQPALNFDRFFGLVGFLTFHLKEPLDQYDSAL